MMAARSLLPHTRSLWFENPTKQKRSDETQQGHQNHNTTTSKKKELLQNPVNVVDLFILVLLGRVYTDIRVPCDQALTSKAQTVVVLHYHMGRI